MNIYRQGNKIEDNLPLHCIELSTVFLSSLVLNSTRTLCTCDYTCNGIEALKAVNMYLLLSGLQYP